MENNISEDDIFVTKKVFGKERQFLLANIEDLSEISHFLSDNNIMFDSIFYPPLWKHKMHLTIPHFASFITGFSFPIKVNNIELFNSDRMICTWKGERTVSFVNFLPLNLEFANVWHLRYEGVEPITIHYAEMKNPKYRSWGSGEPVFTDFHKDMKYALGIAYGTCTIIPKTISLI